MPLCRKQSRRNRDAPVVRTPPGKRIPDSWFYYLTIYMDGPVGGLDPGPGGPLPQPRGARRPAIAMPGGGSGDNPAKFSREKWRCRVAQNVADAMWAMLERAGVQRCYGIVGDALNPVIDALRRNGKIEFIHVRHEEYGVFAAVAEAYLSGAPVAVCGTAGPGVTHLFNGLMDARKEGAAIIAIAGDVETKIMDSAALEELNPYKFFDTACLYVGRVVNAEQARAVITTAIMTAVIDKGPTVISMPGDIASAKAPNDSSHEITIPAPPVFRPADADLEQLAEMIEAAKKVAIFGGDGCRDAREEVLQLAARLQAPVGYTFRGKQWLEHDNPNAVGMTGLLGYGGAYKAIHDADLVLLLGTDFPFSEFLPGGDVKKVQIDRNPKHTGREQPLTWGLWETFRRPSP